MIQFNLLPDVKQTFIKAQRVKRTVTVVSVAIAGAAVGITILLFMVVNVYQKVQLDNLSDKIERDTKTLKNTDDLDKILTIQNQLNNLTPLHEAKPITSRLRDYISAVTPQQVSYAKIELDMEENSMQFTGAADSLKTVNQFIDTLKFTKYDDGSDEDKNAFSDVVLDTFGRDDKGASFKIKLKFDTVIFDNKSKITFKVPNIVTTRSITEKPSSGLFQELSNPEEEEE
jgi:Tfp pilus assembly protein PilN